MSNLLRTVAIGGVILLILVSGFGLGGAVATADCQSVEDRQICITDFSVSDERLVVGQQSEFSVTIENTGNETATGAVLLHTVNPKNETNNYQLKRVMLAEGEQETLTRKINATTPGVHGMKISVMDAETLQNYDISAGKTIEVLEEHPKELGGPIDRTEIALGVLIAVLLGMLALGYRQFQS